MCSPTVPNLPSNDGITRFDGIEQKGELRDKIEAIRLRGGNFPYGRDVLHITCTLQRHKTENSKQIFPEKELRSSVLISTFMCLWEIYTVYSHDRSAYSAAGNFCGSILGIYKSLTDCGKWD
jgi:hypothetical protein